MRVPPEASTIPRAHASSRAFRPTGPATARPIVCLSSQPWDDLLWTNKQHIMTRLGKRHRVFYVEMGGQRPARLSGARSVAGVLDQLTTPAERRVDDVTVLTFPSPWPGLRSLPAGRALDRLATFELRVELLRRDLRRRGIEDAIVWVYHPGYADTVASLPHSLLVYDCVDEFSAFPEHAADPMWIAARDRRLCQRADVVFTTSPELFEARRRLNSATFLVPNVGDAPHFGKARAPETPIPRELAILPKPVVGFVGAVSGYKVDLGWLAHLARARPAWSIVLIGPVGVGDPSTDVSVLAALPNVRVLGHRPYAELPSYVKGLDVAVIPYRDSAYTRACFPIKFFELLASGKPLVVSDLPALAPFLHVTRVARDPDDFVSQCEAAVRDPTTGLAERVALADQNTWEHRVAQLLVHVEEALRERSR